MRLAGALQIGAWNGHSAGVPIKVMSLNIGYGPPLYYGEIPYSGRMISRGFDAGYKSLFDYNPEPYY